MIKIAIAEDNPIALTALKQKLAHFEDIAIEIVAENGQDLITQIKQAPSIDLILMDIEMPNMDGIQATSIIKQDSSTIKIVMITIFDDDEHIFNAIMAGADSYILKETKAQKIYETIQDTINGGAVMSPSIAVKTLKLLKQKQEKPTSKNDNNLLLTDRETEILIEISNGLANKLIADKLFISPFTVKRHIENIYQKLQTHNRAELITKAKDSGLI